eukprot:g25190.t1
MIGLLPFSAWSYKSHLSTKAQGCTCKVYHYHVDRKNQCSVMSLANELDCRCYEICYGVEFKESTHTCYLWKLPLQTLPTYGAGIECFLQQQATSTASTSPSPSPSPSPIESPSCVKDTFTLQAPNTACCSRNRK